MITSYPGLAAKLVPHTISVVVDGADRMKPGYLVRCTAGGRDLGYIWPGFGVWYWRTADGSHYGERVNSHAAVQTLRDVANLASREPGRAPRVVDAQPELPWKAEMKARHLAGLPLWVPPAPRESRGISTRAEPAARPDPPVQPQHIVWGAAPVEMDAADLTAKIREALGRHQR